MSNGLGRIHRPDPRDANYPLRALIPEQLTTSSRVWRKGRNMPLDQGDTPRCVGFAWAGWLYTAPIQRIKSDPNPDWIYTQAQLVDGIEGQHDGTTTRAGAQVVQQAGHIESYHWGQSIDDVRDFVLEVGPLVVGTAWLTGMDEPDSKAVIRATGDERGGHEYLVRGFHDGLYVCEQSWGEWARHGVFYLPEEDMKELVFDRGDGEACAATEKKA